MKKIILIMAVAVASAGSMKAQVAKGNIMLGGGIGFNSTKSETKTLATGTTVDNPKRSTFYIAPMAGYFVTDRLAAGLSINYTSTKTTSMVNSTPDPAVLVESVSMTSTFGVGVFARYYMPINESFYFWGQLNIGFGSGKTDTEFEGTTTANQELKTFNVGIAPGFSFFPSTRYSLDFSVGNLGMQSTTTNTSPGTVGETETKASSAGLTFDMRAVTIGATIYF